MNVPRFVGFTLIGLGCGVLAGLYTFMPSFEWFVLNRWMWFGVGIIALGGLVLLVEYAMRPNPRGLDPHRWD